MSRNTTEDRSGPAATPPDALTAALAATLRPLIAEAVRDAIAELGVSEPAPELLTADETAALLRCSKATLYRLSVPHLIVGSARRWRRADVLAWVSQRSHEGGEHHGDAHG